ncbi:hypothetical protein ACFL6N_06110 [Thermodesulfobacteriota bacterium]
MTRKIISEKELVSWINSQFKNTENCKNISISGINRLQEQDENGCNWSSNVTLKLGGDSQDICERMINKIIKEAYLEFNLE